MRTGDSMIYRPPLSGWMSDLDSVELFNNYKMHELETGLNGVEILEEAINSFR
jgi:hypothetical protein